MLKYWCIDVRNHVSGSLVQVAEGVIEERPVQLAYGGWVGPFSSQTSNRVLSFERNAWGRQTGTLILVLAERTQARVPGGGVEAGNRTGLFGPEKDAPAGWCPAEAVHSERAAHSAFRFYLIEATDATVRECLTGERRCVDQISLPKRRLGTITRLYAMGT
jgi:hypothetical protein